MKVVLRKIHHDGEGFAALARLHAQTKNCFFDEVEIDMRSTTWFDADMCAAFGAVLYRLGDQLNTIELTHVCPLGHPFPGTVVSVEINTADQNSYSLSSELTTDDIF